MVASSAPIVETLEAKLRVGGVPEHFNAPFRIGKDAGVFVKNGCDIEWVEQACGTGEMVKNLRNGNLDVAIALTEGLTAAIVKDAYEGVDDLRIIGTYTLSPLCWAISSHKRDGRADSIDVLDDLEGCPIGISRYGSGSHIMTYVLAKQRGWKSHNSFKVLGNFKGLRDGVNDNTANAFLWETFTTKPYHDSGEVSRLGDITTPWPAFMIACRTSVIEQQPDKILALIRSITASQELFVQSPEAAIRYVVEHYGNTPEDAAKWFSGLQYARDAAVSPTVLSDCMATLIEAEVIARDIPVYRLVSSLTKLEDDVHDSDTTVSEATSDSDDPEL